MDMAKNILKNSKIRTLILLGGGFLLIIIIAIIIGNRKPDPLKKDESQVSKIPQITAIPGNVTSEKYQELQQEDNRRRAEKAKTSGGSAIATIIGSKDKDALNKSESFGIEGDIQPCAVVTQPQKTCAGTEYNKEFTAKLISEVQKTPADTYQIMQKNPCFAKALCLQNPDLALKLIENNKEAAKKMLQECPDIAKALAEKNPDFFKQVMLENPDLAKKIAETNPDLMKKLMSNDPEFAQKMSKVSPDLMKTLMKNDPDFADKMGKANPDMIKDLMKSDPEFARTIARNNPGMVKKLMLDDPAFGNTMAASNPDMVKDLMKNDPEFARQLAKNNPALVKKLMQDDPAFATLMSKENPDMVKQLISNDPEFAKTMSRLTQVKSLPPVAAQSAKEIQAEKARQIQLNEQQQKQIATMITNMESQSKSFYSLWTETTAQKFVAGDKKDDKKDIGAGTGSADSNTESNNGDSSSVGPVILKAGTILFASLNTAVNSDEPGPVMATIVQGEYQGAKIIGSLQLATQAGSAGSRPEKVTLSFDTLVTEDSPKSIGIKAVAIDPDTARTALATDVDHHYLLRYGTLFASSFMTGYAQVISSQGTTQTSSTSGVTQTTTPTLSPKQEIYAALGQVGKKFGDATSSVFTTPNTITVDAGTGFGLLILQDVTASSL